MIRAIFPKNFKNLSLIVAEKIMFSLKPFSWTDVLNDIIIATNGKEQGPQGPQMLRFLKTLEIQNPQLIPGIFTPATIINDYLKTL